MATIGHNNPFVSIESLSTDDKKKLKNAIQEMNDSMTRVASERDLQKEVTNKINEDLGIDKKLFRRLAKTYFKANFGEEQELNKQFEDYYQGVLR